MKVTLQSLTMCNFKKYAQHTIVFDGKDTAITAKNGVGKTTIKNAFLWCLTGKDEDGKTDGTAIRTVGQPVEVSPDVSVVLSIDGINHTFTRKLEATYTGRGADKTYKGDATALMIDGVPKSVTEYNAALSQIFPIEPSVWLDIAYFTDDTKYKPEERRKVLIDCFGQVSDEDIKLLNPAYTELFEAKGVLSVDDFKIAQKEIEKSCTAELGRGKTQGTIQARIDEAVKAIVNPELTVENQQKKIADLTEQIRVASVGDDSNIKANLAKAQTELAEAKQKYSKELTEKKNKKVAKVNASYTKALSARSEVEAQIAALNSNIKQSKDSISIKTQSKQNWLKRLSEIDAETPSIETVCPTCGQPLPKDRIEEAVANYNENKATRMDECEARAKEIDAEIASLNSFVATAEQKLAELEEKRTAATAEVVVWQNELVKIQSEPTELPKEARAVLQRLQDEVDSLSTAIQMSGTGEKVADLTVQLRVEQSLLAQAEANERQRERVKALQAQQQKTAAELSKAQRMIALCDSFIIDKARFIEQSISSHFVGVTFSLFDFFKNGEIKNACRAIVDGKPYRLLSFSQKILANIAIINGLSAHYDFAAPVFIDNCSELDAGSIAALTTAGQKIIIKVSDGDFKVESLL